MKPLKIRVSRIKEIADIIGQPDYLADYIKQGVLSPDGRFLFVDSWVRVAMRDKYRSRGLGDYIAMVARPIARGVRVMTAGAVDLVDCGGCKDRQKRANEAFPAQSPK